MTKSRRSFGSIRKRVSGRYQVRYTGEDGQLHPAPETFATEVEARRWLTLAEAQMMRGDWIDPKRGQIELSVYGENWITERPGLRPRTVALYRQLLRSHITPHLGTRMVGDLRPPAIRAWRTKLLNAGVSQTVAAKAYRLLRAILNTAVHEDELIKVNPCRVKGADKEDTAERPVLTLDQVFALADLMPPKFRAMILLTVFGCLRWGEVTALQRRDLDLVAGKVRVQQAYGDAGDGTGLTLGPPKSRAGKRVVSIPPGIVRLVAEHLDAYVPEGPTALIFTGVSKRRPPLRRNNFPKLVGWREAVTTIGAPGLHFHDLRHTGNTLAAGTGASTRDLMTRMGHDSPRAALLYQHATAQADLAIAQALDGAIKGLAVREGVDRGRDDTNSAG
jgi:integrase